MRELSESFLRTVPPMADRFRLAPRPLMCLDRAADLAVAADHRVELDLI